MTLKKMWKELGTTHHSLKANELARRQKHAENRHIELASRLRETAEGIGDGVALDVELRLSEDDDEAFLLDEINSAAATYRAALKRAAMALDGRRE